MMKVLPTSRGRPIHRPVVHLLDPRGTPDPTLDAVDSMAEGHHRLVIDLQSPLGRLRGRRAVKVLAPDILAAWGEAAVEAIRTLPQRRIYRPSPHLVAPPRPVDGVEVFAANPFQKHQFLQAGWQGEFVSVLLPPADPVKRNPTRPGEPGDVLWWLSADAHGKSGWREAIWAVTLLHLAETRTRRHRILLTGDGCNLVRARRFIVQLGLPELGLLAAGASPEEAVAVADAALFLPEGPADARLALLARASGLPIVHNGRWGLGELLAASDRVVVCSGRRPREIVKGMLQLARSGLERARMDESLGAAACQRQWHRLLRDGQRG